MSETPLGVRHDVAELADGLRLHYAESGGGDGVPVVLVHGWPDSWFSWSRVLPLLDPRLHVYAFDQRGFGDSDDPDGGYSIDGLAEDVQGFCAAVGLDRANLVGHSLGTFVVRCAAERHPDLVDRLVLVGSAPRFEGELRDELLATVADLTDPVPEEFVREFQASTVHHPVPAEFFDGIVAESRKVRAHVYREAIQALGRYDDTAELGAVRAPTLMIWGEADALFDRRQQDLLLAALPDARLLVHPDTGHCPNWERPEGVAVQINEFLLAA